ncbi:MAG: hypothetical protein FWG84_10300 [Bacteroidales bacterium]|nr:hypothetical protein [Bacteroidales bacterium]
MQEKVDLLISFVENLNGTLDCLEKSPFSQQLTKACFCLKSHDLIGLDIIKKSIEKNINDQDYTDENFIQIKKQILQLICEIEQDFQKDVIPISTAEDLFLNLSYNKFYDIFSEVYTKDFWGKAPYYRLTKISQAFSIYSEILNYEPFEGVFKWLEKYRPPMEAEISGQLFKFIRNILVHFPFFDNWNEIWISQELVNWKRPNQSIDKFLKKFCGKTKIKYRFKENLQKGFTYVSINFPEKYDNEKIYLKDIICEEEGVKFTLVMMLKVLNTQVESVKNEID